MRDVIKTERARKIINFLTGKIVRITEEEDGIAREKIVTGIYGTGESVEMQQVCIAFEADFGKDDGGMGGAQFPYEDWETLIETGRCDIECTCTIELV